MNNDKRYTYYLYYMNDTKEIYAYTDSKLISKEFDENRDIGNSIIKHKKQLTKSEVNILAQEYQTNIISIYEINVYDRNEQYEFKVPFPMTEIEYLTLVNQKVQLMSTYIYSYCWSSPKIFNCEVQKALKYLYYNIVHSRVVGEDDKFGFKSLDDILKPDDFGIFLRLFGKTMRQYKNGDNEEDEG